LKCVVRDCDDETAIAINLAENLEHAKVPELDLMEFCQYLVDLKNDTGSHRYSREWVADKCNRSESWVSLTLELNQLPQRVKNMMSDDRVTRTATLQFLQTERDKIDEVIEKGQAIVRDEKMAEAKVADDELKLAEIEMSDAENDLEIHQMMQNDSLVQMAQKRVGTAKKRVSAASEKRDVAIKDADNPKLTADVINKANLLVPGAKKGAPKAMPVKSIKELHVKFKDFRQTTENNGDTLIYSVVESLFEVILGHRVCDSVETIITEEKSKLTLVTTSIES
jgi:ParB-like chromosome segregation protein Spo0J